MYATPAYGLGGVVGFIRGRTDDTLYESQFQVEGVTNAGAREVLFKAGSSTAGIYGLSVGPATANIDPPNAANRTGAQLQGDGALVASKNGYSMLLQRQSSDGGVAYFYRGTAVVGNISVTGSACTFNSTSRNRR